MPRSTPEQRAIARAMAAKGRSLGQIAYRVGFSPQTVRTWLKPDVAEQRRVKALEYRREHHERLNAHAREYMRRKRKGRCPVCRQPTPRAGVKECRSCREEDQRWLWTELQMLWNDGLTVAEIAERTRRSRDSVASHIRRMRAAGWNVPKRKAAPERVREAA